MRRCSASALRRRVRTWPRQRAASLRVASGCSQRVRPQLSTRCSRTLGTRTCLVQDSCERLWQLRASRCRPKPAAPVCQLYPMVTELAPPNVPPSESCRACRVPCESCDDPYPRLYSPDACSPRNTCRRCLHSGKAAAWQTTATPFTNQPVLQDRQLAAQVASGALASHGHAEAPSQAAAAA